MKPGQKRLRKGTLRKRKWMLPSDEVMRDAVIDVYRRGQGQKIENEAVVKETEIEKPSHLKGEREQR